MRLIVIGLVAVGCWTLSALVAWAIVRVGTRHQMPEEPEDGVQPWDARSVTLASGAETRIYWH